MNTPITVAYGDGIGPEIMETTLQILEEAGALLDVEKVEIGEKVYLTGHPTGIEDSTWKSLQRTRVFLKAPITTPQGGGFKSLNVTVRTTLGLYANVRPCVSYHPFVSTKHPKMDVVIVRENEEDLYTGIEYRQTVGACQALKMISRMGCEKIVRYAFEYAQKHSRKKVTCFTKDNIMKISDGLFHKVFDEIAAEYPDIQNEHWIVDIGAAKLADTPEAFDVIVMPNLYGDILSDVAAQIAGSVGLAGSANIGKDVAMFEAIHGSAPRRAGQNLANPSGLLLAGVMMLDHIGQIEVANNVHNAWLKTLEDGIHTYDVFNDTVSKQKVGTKEFAQEVIRRLGKLPSQLKAITQDTSPKAGAAKPAPKSTAPTEKKELVGVDVFMDASDAGKLERAMSAFNNTALKLTMISNRGVRTWPNGQPETSCIDQWRCRFISPIEGTPVTHQDIAGLLHTIANTKLDFIKTENLYTFDGNPGFSHIKG